LRGSAPISVRSDSYMGEQVAHSRRETVGHTTVTRPAAVLGARQGLVPFLDLRLWTRVVQI
jgi:hypothetical protein